jgi:beta-glucosidase-like glycosyl hydrolase
MEMSDGESRYSFDAKLTPQDISDTYLPAFEACTQAKALGVMCSYNAVNGAPSCANRQMLQGVLRDQLGFDGYVVGDCNAVGAMVWGHYAYKSSMEATAAAIKAGTDLLCEQSRKEVGVSKCMS